ncbi:protein BIC1-like [Carya illinoinensis]|uniref:Protein BIC1 n=1 Tax=Carya illinoinensis TaxID=32201 RepID=A0A8T1P8M1_CARIL|nr:protein BIC1-like [Carya illinoinensis]KAG6638063.1 hypothetical protein CIPAW_10G009300 [Carya illinoinensis]KAG6638064.1 hypothetical protein CIPAW_10G009300 [Carya illinoinensis]
MKETPTKMDRQHSAVFGLHTPSKPLESNMKKSQRSDELHDTDQEQQSRPPTDKKNNTPSSSSRTRRCEGDGKALLLVGLPSRSAEDVGKEPAVASDVMPEDTGRERLKRHRVEVAGRVWIPDLWGQEELLKDWIDCSAFDTSLVPAGIMSARAALVDEGRRTNSSGLRVENRWQTIVA